MVFYFILGVEVGTMQERGEWVEIKITEVSEERMAQGQSQIKIWILKIFCCTDFLLYFIH